MYVFRIAAHDGLRTIELQDQVGSEYKPNTHQTDILCQVSVQLAYNIAARSGFNTLRAAEWCAGYGAAAICLAAIGCSYVEASDVNHASLEGVAKNSLKNHVRVDSLYRDVLEWRTSRSEDLFDLIVANPPCVPDCAVSQGVVASLEKSMRAGQDGLLFFREILLSARQQLRKDGCLAIVLTSNMDLVGAIRALTDVFGSDWYAHPVTPVLANVAKMTPDDERAERMLAIAERKDSPMLVFRDLDGSVKRLTWIIVAHNFSIQRKLTFDQRLPFFPFGQTTDPANIPLTKAVSRVRLILQRECNLI